jgi:CheY-like chemotaxis protein
MGESVRVLVAEDQESEVIIYQNAFRRCGISGIYYVNDGREAVEYLSGDGQYADRQKHPFPTCMLLDLKMPRMDGLDVLQWMLDHPTCRVIPTVMMSNSGIPADINRAYMLGVNAYFTKPTRLQEMVDVLALIHHFWTVSQKPELPRSANCG